MKNTTAKIQYVVMNADHKELARYTGIGAAEMASKHAKIRGNGCYVVEIFR